MPKTIKYFFCVNNALYGISSDLKHSLPEKGGDF